MATVAAARGAESKGLDFAGFCITQLVNVLFALNVIASKVIVTATAPFLAVTMRMGVVLLICAPAFRLMPGRNKTLACYGLLNGTVPATDEPGTVDGEQRRGAGDRRPAQRAVLAVARRAAAG